MKLQEIVSEMGSMLISRMGRDGMIDPIFQYLSGSVLPISSSN